MDENVLTALSATIDCSTVNDPVSNRTTSQSPSNERQRPTRVTGRPSRYRDSNFETQFQPVPRRNCRKIQTKSRTGYDVIRAGKYQNSGRGEHKENISPTGNEIIPFVSEQMTREPASVVHVNRERKAKQKQQPTVGRHPHFITNFHQYPFKEMPADARPLRNGRCQYSSGNSKNLAKTSNFNEKRLNYTQHQSSDLPQRRPPTTATMHAAQATVTRSSEAFHRRRHTPL